MGAGQESSSSFFTWVGAMAAALLLLLPAVDTAASTTKAPGAWQGLTVAHRRNRPVLPAGRERLGQ